MVDTPRPELIICSRGEAMWAGRQLRCATGRGGIIREKREGDGGTPAGVWPMREVLFRPDRIRGLATALPSRPLARDEGWCDDPADLAYNRMVRLPYPGHCEQLWLDAAVYDVIVPLGYNDAPVMPGLGSAIFLHVARPDFAPTAGCVALALQDLLMVLREAATGARVRVIIGAVPRR
jgi:L,D-peptidoglycan transpeptidase YkuD (ErfK/YbiS/YcfS/YnhG family)